MSDTPNIQDALKAAGAPDYMVLIITKIVSAEDAIREMQATLSARAVELHQREQLLDERQSAFASAVEDMRGLSNRLYGPESELTQIREKLTSIETSGTNRDERSAQQHTHLRERLEQIEQRVGALERKSA